MKLFFTFVAIVACVVSGSFLVLVATDEPTAKLS